MSPTFSYQGFNDGTGLPLNPLIDFITVEPSTGSFIISCTSLIGSYSVKLVGTLPN